MGWRQELGFTPAEALGPIHSSIVSASQVNTRIKTDPNSDSMGQKWLSSGGPGKNFSLGQEQPTVELSPASRARVGNLALTIGTPITHARLQKQTFYSGTLGSLCTKEELPKEQRGLGCGESVGL